jgi:uncharacterized protein VirK/YbjX
VPKKALKRLRQLAYLCCHPVEHHRCASAVRRSRIAHGARIPFKYLGDHLALSLRPTQRRRALASHYELLPNVLRSAAKEGLRDGLAIWRKDVGNGPPLAITLEPSRLAPMEGELQLRFSYRSDLCVLTFLLASGEPFGAGSAPILFIGGMQGGVGCREELREACRLNGEISAAAMLLLSVQAIGSAMGVRQIIAIGEENHVSMSYARSKINFDYRQIWTQAGGVRRGDHYRVPFVTPARQLTETCRSHRSRTRRKRAAKDILRQSIEFRLRHLIRSNVRNGQKPTSPATILRACQAAVSIPSSPSLR